MRGGTLTGIVTIAALAACDGTVTNPPPEEPGEPWEEVSPTECEMAGVDSLGRCEGNDIVRCVTTETSWFIEGTTCATTCADGPTGAHCLEAVTCDAVGPAGRCSGDYLVTCDGSPMITDCGATGAACTWNAGRERYACSGAAALGRFSLSGNVQYEDRAQSPTGLLAAEARPARGAWVGVMRESDGQSLAIGITADDGSYVLHYDAAANEPVYLLVGTLGNTAARPARVERPDGSAYGYGSAAVMPEEQGELDLLVTVGSGIAGPFNVYDCLVRGLDFLGAAGLTQPEAVRGRYDPDTAVSHYVAGSNRIVVAGVPEDDDAFDDAVILHELGHYFDDVWSRSDSPGGSHDFGPSDPRLAWAEGFATYFGSAVRGDARYMDTNVAGGWVWHIDERQTKANATGPMTQHVSEVLVAESLWDIADAPELADDDDPSKAHGHPEVLEVVAGYVASHARGDRGATGVDFVDWLDGWFLGGRLDSCDAVRSIVTDARRFPYDYAGPGGTCPDAQ